MRVFGRLRLRPDFAIARRRRASTYFGLIRGTALMTSHIIAAVDEIPPGTRKLADVNGRAIGGLHLGGEFFALNNRCPHRGGSLFHGIQTGLVQSPAPGEYCL